MKITFITINLNNKEGLKSTLISYNFFVYSYEAYDTELIVIDGLSTDGSADIINQYNQIIDNWVSENDSGIYDAMNKGVELSQGEMVCFMNSGDVIIPNGMKMLFDEIKDLKYAYAGRDVYIDCSYGFPFLGYMPKLLRMPSHQSMIIPRYCLLQRPFNTSYTISSDLDCKLYLYKNKILKRFNYVVAAKESGGKSHQIKDLTHLHNRAKEHFSIAYRHFGFLWATINYIKFFTWHFRKIK